MDTGLLCLPELLDPDLVTKARVLLRRHLDQRSICPDDPEKWPRGPISKLGAVAKRQSIPTLCSGAVRDCVDEPMAGRDLATTTDYPVQLLVTFPDADMRALHAPSPNTSGQPRLMATARYIDQDLVSALYDA